MFLYKLCVSSYVNFLLIHLLSSDTHVMKLFDRSVDLAQFNENTPLYPICRSWIKNQPHNNLNNQNRSSSPESDAQTDEDVIVYFVINLLFVNFFLMTEKLVGYWYELVSMHYRYSIRVIFHGFILLQNIVMAFLFANCI